jgi:hypothetical protein
MVFRPDFCSHKLYVAKRWVQISPSALKIFPKFSIKNKHIYAFFSFSANLHSIEILSGQCRMASEYVLQTPMSGIPNTIRVEHFRQFPNPFSFAHFIALQFLTSFTPSEQPRQIFSDSMLHSPQA